MNGLTYTLLGDGPSARLLDLPIRWQLRQWSVRVEAGYWADLRQVEPRPTGLTERVRAATDLYPSDVLFIHRDAETSSLDARVEEIRTAARAVTDRYVAVVPIRMTEAWLLHDEAAIRAASGNPRGKAKLRLPPVGKLEQVPDPKHLLLSALLDASELGGRRREKKEKEFGQMRARTAELIADFSPITGLAGFQAFREALSTVLSTLGHLHA